MNDLRVPPLLRTKLHRPPYAADVVLRSELLARLDRGVRYPLTLVSAPAGFGKSTLLSAWLERCVLPSTWLSLDAEDSNPNIFLSYLIEAVRVLHPDACAETEALTRLAEPVAATILAHQLINELDCLSEPFVLVLDDYDRIDNTTVHEVVAILLRRPPRGLHLVISARRDPPLPLARLRAEGHMVEVRMGDLRLRLEDLASFWRSSSDEAIDDAGIAALDRVLEGWPVGMRLAVISARLSSDPQQTLASLTTSSAHATDYLFQEIFRGLPQDKQQWLLRIALLDRFCAPLCEMLRAPEELGPSSTGADFIDWLKSMNLFLVPLDDEDHWHRFHHLFLQLLRQQQVKRLGADTVKSLRLKASAWLADAGMADEALQYAVLAGAVEQQAAIVERHGMALLNQEDWPHLQRWLALFPPGMVDDTPPLLRLKVHLLVNQLRLAEIDGLAHRLDGDVRFIPDFAHARAQSCFWRADVEQSLHYARVAFQTTPADFALARGSVVVYLALALQMSGSQDEALGLLLPQFSNAGEQSPAMATRVMLALLGLYWAEGNLDYVISVARRQLAISEQHHLLASRGWAHYFFGCVHYWRNELEQAEVHFAGIVEYPFGVHRMTVLHSYFGLALTYLAQQRTTAADDVVGAAQGWAAESGSLLLVRQAEAFTARCALAKGERAAAFAWCERQVEPLPQLPSFFLEEPLFIQARICLARGGDEHLARAAALIDQIGGFLRRTHNSLRMLDVLALEALLHQARGEAAAAQAVLRRALAWAEPAKIVRPFVDFGPPMAALLHEAAKGPTAAPYAGQVLAAFPHGGIEAAAQSQINKAAPAPSVEPLTDRELEVVSLLAQRLSNKEIAEILVVSPITVKSHMRNLFSKLEVSGRREAVERARGLGLLH